MAPYLLMPILDCFTEKLGAPHPCMAECCRLPIDDICEEPAVFQLETPEKPGEMIALVCREHAEQLIANGDCEAPAD